MEKYISITSLIIALLAVFIGPLITYHVAKLQLRIMQNISNKQIVAPMRQAWINSFRDEISELLSSALHFYVSGFEYREDKEYKRLVHLEEKIVLMLNVNELEHQKLEKSMRSMIDALKRGRDFEKDFISYYEVTKMLTRSIIKFEWDQLGMPIT